MGSLNTYNQSKRLLRAGFTIVEILIVLTILGLILSAGIFIGMDFFRTRGTDSEIATIVSLLQNARSQSMNNINGARHGLHFASPLSYTMFECGSATPTCTSHVLADPDKDLRTDSQSNVTLTSPALPFDIVFDQLSGCLSGFLGECASDTVTISLNDGVKNHTITINAEGRINWE